MRKLKLEMHMTVDGFVAGPEKQLDWIGNIASDPALGKLMGALLDSCDTMILGHHTTDEIVGYWENVADNQPESPEHTVAQQIVGMRKIAFSKRHSSIKGRNVETENGDLVKAVEALKNEPGKDILVYGGVQFVRDLVVHDLIDEYHLIVNPVSLGNGLRIFLEKKALKLVKSVSFNNGIVVNTYVNG